MMNYPDELRTLSSFITFKCRLYSCMLSLLFLLFKFIIIRIFIYLFYDFNLTHINVYRRYIVFIESINLSIIIIIYSMYAYFVRYQYFIIHTYGIGLSNINEVIRIWESILDILRVFIRSDVLHPPLSH